MDAFARSLLETPRHLLNPENEPRGGLKWADKPMKGNPGRPPGKRLDLPAGSIEAAGLCWIIGQITKPVSWTTIAEWYQRAYNIEVKSKTLTEKAKSLARERKVRTFWPRKLPEKVLSDCLQHALVLAAHGSKQPWANVADRLWAKHRINEAAHDISMKVRTWARAQ